MAATAKGVTVYFSRMVVENIHQEGEDPHMKKSQPQEYGNRYLKVAILAEMVGFEPTCRLNTDKTISSLLAILQKSGSFVWTSGSFILSKNRIIQGFLP